MNGMWLMIFWMATFGTISCRPQNNHFEDPKQSVELVPLLYGDIFPSWAARDHLQPIFHSIFSLYQLTPISKNGEGSVDTESTQMKYKAELQTSQTKAASKMNSVNVINRMIEDLTQDSLSSMNGNPSLAPYRFHPLLNFLKQRINLGERKIIELKNGGNDEPDTTTTLILKPVARSVAGVNGKAISNPVSRAALRKGVNVDILFEPDAVAIAGPGGIAHAESDLEIFYEDDDDKVDKKN